MKTYIAKLTQGSQDPEVIAELENSLGSVSFTRIEEGRFRLTCAGAFPDEAKISGLREFHFTDNGKFRLFWDDETESSGDSLILETYNHAEQLSDNILSVTEIRVAVYD
jgi:hypothetical protein